MKRFTLVLFVFIIFMCVPSCSDKEERFDYPDKFTPEYCYHNYSPMELNYAYSHTYNNSVLDSRYNDGHGTWRWFYAIPNVSEDEFLACHERFGLVGSSYDAILYRSNDFETIPLEDWSINYIELCQYNYDKFSYTEEESIRKYGDIIYHSNIKSITDTALVDQLLDCIKNKSKYYSDVTKGQQGDTVEFFENNKRYEYAIRIHFKETEMIMWHSTVEYFEDHYYLSYYSGTGLNPLIPLTEELEAFISSSIDTSN